MNRRVGITNQAWIHQLGVKLYQDRVIALKDIAPWQDLGNEKSCEKSKDGSSTNSTDSTDDTQSIPSTSSNRLEY